jgi:hypothetical protein
MFQVPMISSNGGINLWIGNNEHASGGYRVDPADDPFRNVTGEPARDRLGTRLAFQFMRSQPLQAIGLVPRKFAYLFSSETPYVLIITHLNARTPGRSFANLYLRTPPMLHIVINIHYLFFITAGILGFFFFPSGRKNEFRFVALLGAFWIAVHLVFFGNHRFHYPLMPLFILSATYAMVHFHSFAFRKEPAKIAIAIALILCFVAILIAEYLTAFARATV